MTDDMLVNVGIVTIAEVQQPHLMLFVECSGLTVYGFKLVISCACSMIAIVCLAEPQVVEIKVLVLVSQLLAPAFERPVLVNITGKYICRDSMYVNT